MCRDLCRAVEEGDLERAQELLDNGSSIHDIEENSEFDDWTPLEFAHGSLEMTRFLLDRGASLDKSFSCKTAFHMASEDGNVKVVRLYLDRGTEVDMYGEYGSPLFYASRSGMLKVARLLLDRGADVNFIRTSWSGGGPLHVACAKGILAMVELLLARGADVNARNDDCGTPLAWTCDSGSVEIGRLLLERDAKMEDNILLSFFNGPMNDYHVMPSYSHGRRGDAHVDLLRLFLDRGANRDVRDSADRTPLMRACCDRQISMSRLLLDRGADVNVIDSKGQTPLLAVLLTENVRVDRYSELVRLLLDRGAAVDTTTRKRNETALHIASRRCEEKETVEMLLDRGANMEARDVNGATPLHGASEAGCFKPMQLLLGRGASVSATNGNGKFPLELVFTSRDYDGNDRLDLLILLLNHGANPDVTFDGHRTPLIWSCVGGEVDEVTFLLDRGVRVDGIDGEEGLRPLHATCRSGWETVASETIVRLLMDRGADVNSVDSKGETPLHAALNREDELFEDELDDNSNIIKLLLDRGAVVDTPTREKKETALHFASANSEKEVVEMLLDRGANVEAQDVDGDTPLHWACQAGRLAAVQLLLDRGAPVHVASGNAKTPLHFAFGHLKIAKLLLDRGANVNATDENGKTPLHLICEMDYECDDSMDDDEADHRDQMEIVCLLLDRGADVEAKTNNGSTPMHLACQANNVELVWLFVRRYPWLVLSQSFPTGDGERQKKRQRVSS